eukprot:1716230-Pyramimonas_sp.AAC.1
MAQMILTLETTSNNGLRGNPLNDVDPEGQQRLPQQLRFKAPVLLHRRALSHVAALHLAGRTGLAGCRRWRDQRG